jgi:basic amino acid/polyamine antiporter, APA family
VSGPGSGDIGATDHDHRAERAGDAVDAHRADQHSGERAVRHRVRHDPGLTVFTKLVALTVVTVAIPYLFSACAQLSYLVSRRRRVQGWALARDATIAGAGVLFSLWVTFAAGYQAVYLALLVVLAGVVVYAFLKAYRERTGQITAPTENPPLEPAPGTGK